MKMILLAFVFMLVTVYGCPGGSKEECIGLCTYLPETARYLGCADSCLSQCGVGLSSQPGPGRRGGRALQEDTEIKSGVQSQCLASQVVTLTERVDELRLEVDELKRTPPPTTPPPAGPSHHCGDVKTSNPGAANGFHNIVLGGTEQKRVYCAFTGPLIRDGARAATVVAQAINGENLEKQLPDINSGSNWSEWTAHAFDNFANGGRTYYLSLDDFGYLADGSGEVCQYSLNDENSASLSQYACYSNASYTSNANKWSFGTCVGLNDDATSETFDEWPACSGVDLKGGKNPCCSHYSWAKSKSSDDFFDGWGPNGHALTNCNLSYGTSIYNYHNHAGCASDSGLFVFSGSGDHGHTVQAQRLGHYEVDRFASYIVVEHQ